MSVTILELSGQESPVVTRSSSPNHRANKSKAAVKASDAIKPKEVDASRLAFYPDRWKQAQVDFKMLAWEGENVVFLTRKGKDYDPERMTAFVKRLDQGWATYAELIGRQPRPNKRVNGKATICAIPKSNLSCGYGCGYVGSTGIEASAFYRLDWPSFKKHPDSFQHYYFYEMGRNYFVFGDRHSLFTTGFAVFMRYVCMDRLKCKDLDNRTRQTIESCEEIYANSKIGFYDAFTNLGAGEKNNRLKDKDGRGISPSDQPVMYATAMLKLRRDYGGDQWVNRFYQSLLRCKPVRARSIRSAQTQMFNWLVCASLAAQKDLTPVFADRWRMPLSKNQRQMMLRTDWTVDNDPAQLVSLLLADRPAEPKPNDDVNAILPVVVPTPASIKAGDATDACVLNKQSRIILHPNKENHRLLVGHALMLRTEVEILTGLQIPISIAFLEPRPNDIVLSCQTTREDADEKYKLDSGRDGIQVSAGSPVGIAHGTATLLQLIDPDKLLVPSVTIEDHPTADYRALMLDVARNPHSVGVVKDAIRLCRLYKIRFLQLHLTDDQNFTFPFSPVTDNLKNNFCYTREELASLEQYAAARGVTIVPELDLPGHSSRLKQSGYLEPGKTDADVASPENYEKIGKIVDAMIDVFPRSPYFHIGGDESGAGRNLVPFLAAMNKRVRARGKRLLLWEGFHGAPTDQLPATGKDRVIVMAWESTYNAPWDLLKSGYQVINASWKPTYLTGGYGGLIHPGSTGGKRFKISDLYRWDKNTFMHWEPGRPVFEDRGPNDPDRNDGIWNASWIGKADQMIGGQMLYWEQQECSVIHFLAPRIPFLSERLWNPESGMDFSTFKKRVEKVHQRILPVMQPIEILPKASDPDHPVVGLYTPYTGESVKVTFRNRTKIKGMIRYSTGGWSGSLNSPNFRTGPVPDQQYREPIVGKGPLSVRAQLVRADGTPVDGQSFGFYNNWPNRVSVTEFDIGRRTPRQVPDLSALPPSKVLSRYKMPYIRGLMQNVEVRGQMTVTDLVAPGDGEHILELRTQSGHATLFFDQNQNGRFEKDEVLVKDSPNDESGQKATVKLKTGERYRMRIDHATGMPRPVLLLFITTPDGRRSEISQFIQLPE